MKATRILLKARSREFKRREHALASNDARLGLSLEAHLFEKRLFLGNTCQLRIMTSGLLVAGQELDGGDARHQITR